LSFIDQQFLNWLERPTCSHGAGVDAPIAITGIRVSFDLPILTDDFDVALFPWKE